MTTLPEWNLKDFYPSFESKLISEDMNVVKKMATSFSKKYKNEKIDLVDGVRIDFTDSWVQLRKSNTEPIIRIYSEAKSEEKSNNLISEIKTLIKEIAS